MRVFVYLGQLPGLCPEPEALQLVKTEARAGARRHSRGLFAGDAVALQHAPELGRGARRGGQLEVLVPAAAGVGHGAARIEGQQQPRRRRGGQRGRRGRRSPRFQGLVRGLAMATSHCALESQTS